MEFAAGTAAVGLAALARALGQRAAEKPAVQGEASNFGAKVSLRRRKLGAMEVSVHLGIILYLTYRQYTRKQMQKMITK